MKIVLFLLAAFCSCHCSNVFRVPLLVSDTYDVYPSEEDTASSEESDSIEREDITVLSTLMKCPHGYYCCPNDMKCCFAPSEYVGFVGSGSCCKGSRKAKVVMKRLKKPKRIAILLPASPREIWNK